MKNQSPSGKLAHHKAPFPVHIFIAELTQAHEYPHKIDLLSGIACIKRGEGDQLEMKNTTKYELTLRPGCATR